MHKSFRPQRSQPAASQSDKKTLALDSKHTKQRRRLSVKVTSTTNAPSPALPQEPIANPSRNITSNTTSSNGTPSQQTSVQPQSKIANGQKVRFVATNPQAPARIFTPSLNAAAFETPVATTPLTSSWSTTGASRGGDDTGALGTNTPKQPFPLKSPLTTAPKTTSNTKPNGTISHQSSHHTSHNTMIDAGLKKTKQSTSPKPITNTTNIAIDPNDRFTWRIIFPMTHFPTTINRSIRAMVQQTKKPWVLQDFIRTIPSTTMNFFKSIKDPTIRWEMLSAYASIFPPTLVNPTPGLKHEASQWERHLQRFPPNFFKPVDFPTFAHIFNAYGQSLNLTIFSSEITSYCPNVPNTTIDSIFTSVLKGSSGPVEYHRRPSLNYATILKNISKLTLKEQTQLENFVYHRISLRTSTDYINMLRFVTELRPETVINLGDALESIWPRKKVAVGVENVVVNGKMFFGLIDYLCQNNRIAIPALVKHWVKNIYPTMESELKKLQESKMGAQNDPILGVLRDVTPSMSPSPHNRAMSIKQREAPNVAAFRPIANDIKATIVPTAAGGTAQRQDLQEQMKKMLQNRLKSANSTSTTPTTNPPFAPATAPATVSITATPNVTAPLPNQTTSASQPTTNTGNTGGDAEKIDSKTTTKRDSNPTETTATNTITNAAITNTNAIPDSQSAVHTHTNLSHRDRYEISLAKARLEIQQKYHNLNNTTFDLSIENLYPLMRLGKIDQVLDINPAVLGFELEEDDMDPKDRGELVEAYLRQFTGYSISLAKLNNFKIPHLGFHWHGKVLPILDSIDAHGMSDFTRMVFNEQSQWLFPRHLFSSALYLQALPQGIGLGMHEGLENFVLGDLGSGNADQNRKNNNASQNGQIVGQNGHNLTLNHLHPLDPTLKMPLIAGPETWHYQYNLLVMSSNQIPWKLIPPHERKSLLQIRNNDLNVDKIKQRERALEDYKRSIDGNVGKENGGVGIDVAGTDETKTENKPQNKTNTKSENEAENLTTDQLPTPPSASNPIPIIFSSPHCPPERKDTVYKLPITQNSKPFPITPSQDTQTPIYTYATAHLTNKILTEELFANGYNPSLSSNYQSGHLFTEAVKQDRSEMVKLVSHQDAFHNKSVVLQALHNILTLIIPSLLHQYSPIRDQLPPEFAINVELDLPGSDGMKLIFIQDETILPGFDRDPVTNNVINYDDTHSADYRSPFRGSILLEEFKSTNSPSPPFIRSPATQAIWGNTALALQYLSFLQNESAVNRLDAGRKGNVPIKKGQNAGPNAAPEPELSFLEHPSTVFSKFLSKWSIDDSVPPRFYLWRRDENRSWLDDLEFIDIDEKDDEFDWEMDSETREEGSNLSENEQSDQNEHFSDSNNPSSTTKFQDLPGYSADSPNKSERFPVTQDTLPSPFDPQPTLNKGQQIATLIVDGKIDPTHSSLILQPSTSASSSQPTTSTLNVDGAQNKAKQSLHQNHHQIHPYPQLLALPIDKFPEEYAKDLTFYPGFRFGDQEGNTSWDNVSPDYKSAFHFPRGLSYGTSLGMSFDYGDGNDLFGGFYDQGDQVQHKFTLVNHKNDQDTQNSQNSRQRRFHVEDNVDHITHEQNRSKIDQKKWYFDPTRDAGIIEEFYRPKFSQNSLHTRVTRLHDNITNSKSFEMKMVGNMMDDGTDFAHQLSNQNNQKSHKLPNDNAQKTFTINRGENLLHPGPTFFPQSLEHIYIISNQHPYPYPILPPQSEVIQVPKWENVSISALPSDIREYYRQLIAVARESNVFKESRNHHVSSTQQSNQSVKENDQSGERIQSHAWGELDNGGDDQSDGDDIPDHYEGDNVDDDMNGEPDSEYFSTQDSLPIARLVNHFDQVSPKPVEQHRKLRKHRDEASKLSQDNVHHTIDDENTNTSNIESPAYIVADSSGRIKPPRHYSSVSTSVGHGNASINQNLTKLKPNQSNLSPSPLPTTLGMMRQQIDNMKSVDWLKKPVEYRDSSYSPKKNFRLWRW